MPICLHHRPKVTMFTREEMAPLTVLVWGLVE